jgi:Sulfotransferase domain
MRPNFLLIGAMKCATTTLWQFLRRHPQIFMPHNKEPGFFSRDEVFSRGWTWYEAQFSRAGGRLAIGEGTTCYTKKMLYPAASERIAKHLPEAKLIYIVRNPIERIESHWRHELSRGRNIPFEEVLRKPDVIDTSCYWRQISAYRKHFSDEQILVLFVEDFVKAPEAVLKECLEFLNVDSALHGIDPKLAVNVSRNYRIDGSLIRVVRMLPGIQSIKHVAPAISKAIGWKLRRPMPERPRWPIALRRHVVDQLAADSALFLNHYGKPADWWQFDWERNTS